ncbi:MAG: DUF4169 family protein [Alphaproteobacteria bacterium]|nr:DUF4169 family protein [Alphaproteobacteria bacterium]
MKPVNLRQARKDKARQEKRARGDAAAAANGRSKAQKTADSAGVEKLTAHLDAHKRAP